MFTKGDMVVLTQDVDNGFYPKGATATVLFNLSSGVYQVRFLTVPNTGQQGISPGGIYNLRGDFLKPIDRSQRASSMEEEIKGMEMEMESMRQKIEQKKAKITNLRKYKSDEEEKKAILTELLSNKSPEEQAGILLEYLEGKV